MLYPAILPNDGIEGFSDLVMFGINGGANNSKVHLFDNDYVPTALTVVGDFTESAALGMQSQVLPVAVNSGIDPSGRDIWTFPQTVFTAVGPGLPVLLYGYWVDFLDPLTLATRVLWCQRFNAAQVLIIAGDLVKFTLSWGGKQC